MLLCIYIRPRLNTRVCNGVTVTLKVPYGCGTCMARCMLLRMYTRPRLNTHVCNGVTETLSAAPRAADSTTNTWPGAMHSSHVVVPPWVRIFGGLLQGRLLTNLGGTFRHV